MSRRITALNNTGIKCLEQGFFDEAIRSFRMAMECVNASLLAQDKDQEQQDLRDSISGSCSMEEQDECQQNIPVYTVPLACLSPAHFLDASPHNKFDVYQAAMAFPRLTHKSKNATTATCAKEITAILLYNLGLSHHLAGCAQTRQSQDHLRHAAQYYRSSMSIFKSYTDLRFDNSSFGMVLGILVNLGHVFTHFCCTDQAQACTERLQELLDHASPDWLSVADGEFFFSALTYIQHDAVAAPAA